MLRAFVVIWGLFYMAGTPALAQTTGGIPGPAVSADERSVQLRVAHAPDTDRWAARLHYQQGISDALRWRVVVQGTDFETGSFEPVFVQGELQWEFDENPKWGKALRFDVRLAENDDGADGLGVDLFNQFALGRDTFARVDILTNLEVGARRRSGVAVDVRAMVGYRASDRTTLVLETFDGLGRGKTFGELKRSRQVLGPGISHKLGGGVSVFGSVLFGLNDASPDTDLRFWLTKGF